VYPVRHGIIRARVARVLLIDDDIAEISAVKRVLARGGHQAILATSIADAVALAEQERPAAAVLSAACENGGGADLARRLVEEAARLPVLVLGRDEEVPGGAVRIPRPLDPSQLQRELELALEKAPGVPVARIALQALSAGSAAGSPAGPRAAAEALLRRAAEVRRERPEPATAPPSPPAPPPDETGPVPQQGPRPVEFGPEDEAAQRQLVADIVAEFDAVIDKAIDVDVDGPAPGEEGDGGHAAAAEPSAEQAADEIARRAEAEAERRRAKDAEERRAAERAAEDARLAEAARERAAQEAREAAAPRPAEPPVPEPLAPPRDFDAAPPAEVAPVAEVPELPHPPAELAAGTLGDAPMPRLLALAARARLTGRLDFGSAAPRSVYFEGGRVVGATSGAPHERVEDVALRLGLVTREQHRLAVAAAGGLSSRRAALQLLDRGFLKPEELTPLARRRTEEVVFALFGEVAAPFRYAPARVPPEERTALGRGSLELALDGVRRRWLEPRLGPVLGGPSTLLAPPPHAVAVAELGLSPEESRVASLADGLRTLDEILSDSPLDPLPTRQLLAGLLMVGALAARFRGGDPREPGMRAIDLARLRDKLDQVRRADYFAILGVARDGTPYEVREAAGRLLAEFDPVRFRDQREPGLREKLEEIRRVVAEARDVLSDEALRAEYLFALGS